MSDQRLRELERRWRETGSVDDEAAWLIERVRAGDLTRERLELAAYSGHPAALLAGAPAGPSGAASWLEGLEAWSSVLAAWALVESVEGSSPLLVRFRERLRAALDGELEGVLDELDNGTIGELADDDARRGAKLAILAATAIARDPRHADPQDPDVLRALEVIRPRHPYLDPGTWSYAHSERAVGGRGWVHRLEYTRSRGGKSPGSIPASPGWAPPLRAPTVRMSLVAHLIAPESSRMPPPFVREAAIARALAR